MQGPLPVLLFSGGIDSYIAWHFLSYPPTVYFDLDTPYSVHEICTVQNLVPSTVVDHSLNLADRQEGEKAYIPFRNLYLAMLATKYSDTIYIAGLRDDNVSDKNPAIFEKMSNILSEMEGRRIRVLSPFWHFTKQDAIKWFISVYGKKEAEEKLLCTLSCYDPDIDSSKKHNVVVACRKCPACFRKWNALWLNSIKTDFNNPEMMAQYYESAQEGKYDEDRNRGIITAVNQYRTQGEVANLP